MNVSGIGYCAVTPSIVFILCLNYTGCVVNSNNVTLWWFSIYILAVLFIFVNNIFTVYWRVSVGMRTHTVLPYGVGG